MHCPRPYLAKEFLDILIEWHFFGSVFLDVDDFVRMRPYDDKF